VARSLRRRPAAGAKPAAAFLEEVRRHVGLALDIALLRGEPFVRARARAEIAAFLAAATGGHAVALAVEPHEPGGSSAAAVTRALRYAGRVLRARFHPPADPQGGLPIRPGMLSIFRRRLARIAAGFYRDRRLDPGALARHAAHAANESALLAEALAGLLRSAQATGARAAALRVRQVSHLGLPRAAARASRHGVASPRPPEALAAAAPPGTRIFLLEQLRLALLRLDLTAEGPTAFVETFASASALDGAALFAAQLEATAQHGGLVDLPGVAGEGRDWQVVAEEWGAATDQVVEKVSEVVAQNLEALVTEIRQTGELGQLVAKATAGGVLSDEERRKVKEQLVDLAKAVPALAIFAAPGGAILLPLLARLLPFSILPSAWDRSAGQAIAVGGDGTAAQPPEGAKPGAEGSAKGGAAAQTPAGSDSPVERSAKGAAAQTPAGSDSPVESSAKKGAAAQTPAGAAGSPSPPLSADGGAASRA
jgi:hypothetical protein